MTKIKTLQRTPIFFAVEGEGEQSLIKWFYDLANQKGLHVHLDCEVLKGGGYRSMLEAAVHYRKRKERQKSKNAILLVDGDRDERKDDGWSLLRLKQEASKQDMSVCVQNPNLEGLLLRLMPGKESLQPAVSSVRKQLLSVWPNYEKPADARTLSEKFSLADLLRVARNDADLGMLLKIIGLKE